MNLPAPFTEYTRALLGNEEYEKLSAALDQAPPCQHPAESIVPHRCQFPQFSRLPWCLGVRRGIISVSV